MTFETEKWIGEIAVLILAPSATVTIISVVQKNYNCTILLSEIKLLAHLLTRIWFYYKSWHLETLNWQKIKGLLVLKRKHHKSDHCQV